MKRICYFMILSIVIISCSLNLQARTIIQGTSYASESVLIKFKHGTSSINKANARNSIGAETQYKYKLVPGLELIKAKGKKVSTLIEALSKNPNIEFVEPDYEVKVEITVNDPDFSNLWGITRIGTPEAWDITTGNPNYIIAVIDTGVDYFHDDLKNNMWTNPNEIAGNGIDDDGNGFVDDIHGYDFANNDSDPWDDSGHGTHVAGTICAQGNNNIGVVGVNWNCKIMALKFIGSNGSGWTSDATKSLEYAVEMGVKLSNNSWGGGGYSNALTLAIENAANANHLFVAAAGNDGVDTDLTPHYPSSYINENIISVANTQSNDTLRANSNYGVTSVDLGAPGSSILSTTPSNTYSYYWGTSMSAPHVTGALALLASEHPQWTALQLKNSILQSVEALSSLNNKTLTGGILNVSDALTHASNGIVFAVIGDYGSDDSDFDERDVADLIKSWPTDFVITAGDNRYGTKTMDQAVGKYYCKFLLDAQAGTNCSGNQASINSFFPSLGNHDYSDGGGINEYLDYFTLPGEGIESQGNSGSEKYYDFIKGPIHFFAINSHESSTFNEQKAWLQEKLNSSITPWQIVYFHHAAYSSSSNHGSATQMQWPFADWGADAVFGAHDHTYERLEVNNIPHFVNGLGGRSRYSFGTPLLESKVRYRDNYGAQRVTANDTQIKFEFINVAGSIIDTHTVYSNDTPPSNGTIEKRIIQSSDDIEQNTDTGSMYMDSTDLELGDDLSFNGYQSVGLRFQGLNIPQGVTIDSAYLEFVVDETDSITTNIQIKAENINDAPAFTTNVSNLTNRVFTNNKVLWSIPSWSSVGAIKQSPDISILVQEVVNRSGWISGNDMVFIIEGSGERTAESYDTSASLAPLLHIEYSNSTPVNQKPSASFTSSLSGLTVTFIDTSTDSDGTIETWLWNFGDENNNTEQNPIHVYSEDGIYNVSLTVSDDDGSTDINNSTVILDTTAPTITAPANITKESTGETTPVNLGTALVSDNIDPNPTVSNNSPSTFPIGETIVIWTATDAHGNNASDTQIITITEPSNETPSASFSSSSSGLIVTFTDTSTDSDGTIISWSWDFDDSNSSTNQNDINAYDVDGIYTVKLTVSDNDGATDMASSSITLDTTAPLITAPNDITKESTGETTPVNIGIAIVSDNIDPSPTVSNNSPSTFPIGETIVTWTATDAHGNNASDTQIVTITEADNNEPILSVSTEKIKGAKYVHLNWSGFSDSSSLTILRRSTKGKSNSFKEIFKDTSNDGYEKDTLKSGGTYIYKICEGNICTNEATASF